jgi:hypothetical protein
MIGAISFERRNRERPSSSLSLESSDSVGFGFGAALRSAVGLKGSFFILAKNL